MNASEMMYCMHKASSCVLLSWMTWLGVQTSALTMKIALFVPPERNKQCLDKEGGQSSC